MTWRTTQPSLLVRLRDPEDQSAWTEFHARYGELILRYAMRLGLERADAEDLRQTVLLSLARALPKFEYSRARGRFRSYLGTVVRRAASRHESRPKGEIRHLPLDEMDIAGSAAPALDPVWEEEWRRHHLRLALRRVRRMFDRKSIEVFEMLVEGRTVAEIASRRGMTQAAVYKTKQRVREAMSRLIAVQIRDEERSLE
jgi:RNA polymerase sigma factor (sigma-70 family)